MFFGFNDRTAEFISFSPTVRKKFPCGKHVVKFKETYVTNEDYSGEDIVGINLLKFKFNNGDIYEEAVEEINSNGEIHYFSYLTKNGKPVASSYWKHDEIQRMLGYDSDL